MLTLSERVVRSVLRKREFFNRLKNRPCTDCGGWFEPHQMDFDHRPGTSKVLGVANMVSSNWERSKIFAEIAKCDLVCANCHRDRTFKRGRCGR